MVKVQEREKAIALRKKGRSIGEIAASLRVSKSTVSGWCRDVCMSPIALKRISRRSKQKSTEGLLKYSETRRLQRQRDLSQDTAKGKVMLGNLTDRDVYCIGLGLYWGEGYKRGSQEFGFTNSDPEMIAFYIKWLQVVFDVSRSDLILRVSINQAHSKRIDEVEKYWAKLTGVPLSQFTKSSLIKVASSKVYQNTAHHMGTLRIKVRKGTSMRRQVIGAIKSIEV